MNVKTDNKVHHSVLKVPVVASSISMLIYFLKLNLQENRKRFNDFLSFMEHKSSSVQTDLFNTMKANANARKDY